MRYYRPHNRKALALAAKPANADEARKQMADLHTEAREQDAMPSPSLKRMHDLRRRMLFTADAVDFLAIELSFDLFAGDTPALLSAEAQQLREVSARILRMAALAASIRRD